MPAVDFTVNGTARTVEVEANTKLLWVLRETLSLTGAKYGCGEGQCGACTVLVDGQAVRSCTTRVSLMGGRRIETIESLGGGDGPLHPVQQAMLDHEALQCGYCTPGMVMAAVGLLRAKPSPTADDIVKAMDHNLCRCGTYPRILAAVRQAAGASQRQPR
jgi:aerobic-type carbon monoxide dehydrogenase small subunit (CoxS/CutS family)